ncbi:MAG: CHASE domain-containing protein [Oligoflexia bacterium]|nr:CHASE domain-containing protein [Oligoflexia bacterium]
MPAISKREDGYKNSIIPWIILLLFLGITLIISLYIKSRVDKIAEQEFIFTCKEIQFEILDRLYDYARTLESGVALFNAATSVTREKWHTFNKDQRKDLPGFQAIGFSIFLTHAELASHLQQVRKEGFEAYKIRPEGIRKIYTPIIYVEPFTDKNILVFGYDPFSENIRRLGMEKAMDSGMATLSRKVTLIQQIGSEPGTASIVMYAPVYRKGMPTDSVEQRRAAIYGFVYSAFRMDHLLQGIFGFGHNHDLKNRPNLKIYDGDEVTQKNLLYAHTWSDSDNGYNHRWPKDNFTLLLSVDFNGHHWTLQFEKNHGWIFSMEYAVVWITIVAGTLIALLLFALFRALMNTSTKSRQLAEELTLDLKESELRWQFALEGPGDGLWDWNLESNKIFFSKQWKVMLGYTEQEIGDTLQEWDKRIHPDDKERCYKDLEKHFREEVPFYTNEHRLLCKDNSYKWILDRGKVLQWGVDPHSDSKAKKPLRMIGVHTDISERKRNEEKVMQLVERSQRNDKLESLGVLAGGLAHDFNNLLSGILGYIEIARDACVENNPHSLPKVRESLDKALRSFEHAINLTHQLLTFAKGGVPSKTMGSLVPLIKECTEFALAGSNISCILKIGDDLYLSYFDENQIKQAFTNIIINAKQAMANGGRLVLSANNVELSSGKHIKISFVDEGSGIDPQLLSRVFDPFFTTKKMGHGLGLAIVYSIIKKHHGEITVESVKGQGTTFYIFLPAFEQTESLSPKVEATPVAGAVAVTSTKDNSGHRGGNILILEDEFHIRELFGEILTSLGYKVTYTTRGEEALEWLLHDSSNFVATILDLTIPGGMGGKEVIQQVRAAEANTNSPSSLIAFVCSGYSDDPVLANPAQYGFNDKIPKPFHKSELSALLLSYLNPKSRRGDT